MSSISPPEGRGDSRPVDGLAAETGREGDNRAGLDARVTRYSKARERAVEMIDYSRQEGGDTESARLAACGEYLVFRHYFTIDKIRLHSARFCKQHLICPLCAIRRGAKALRAYLDRFEVLKASEPVLRPYMVTFTVKNGEDLAERQSKLRNSLQRLHKKRCLQRGTSEVEKAAAGVWSYEITNKGNGWHPHVHAIWLCIEQPDQVKLSREWHDLTGDSYIVDVRPITGDPVEGFLEVFKYALKFSDLKLADNWSAYLTLKGERLLASFGKFRGVEVPESMNDDEVGLDDLPYIELFYRYMTGTGYKLISESHPQMNRRAA